MSERLRILSSCRCTGFEACDVCDPPQSPMPLADHGKRFGLWRSLWIVLRGARFYG